MPTYNTDPSLLTAAIRSVRSQTLPEWQLCIADDASTRADVHEVLRHATAQDSRIDVVFRQENGHISQASNSALSLARGEFVALLDHDDLLAPYALALVVDAIRANPHTDLIYTDEDILDGRGRRTRPHFKPDFDAELLLSYNYVSHLGVYRRSIVDAIGGFREGYEGSQDYDLLLRFLGHTSADRVVHLPHVLYHWRAAPGSVASGSKAKPYASDAARRALQDHLDRSGLAARCVAGFRSLHRARYRAGSTASVVVACEPNGDVDRHAASPSDEAAHLGVRVVVAPIDSSGSIARIPADVRPDDILVVVKPGLVPQRSGWLEELIGLASREEVGLVGGRIDGADGRIVDGGLLFCPDGRVRRRFEGIRSDAPGYMKRAELVGSVSAVTLDACAIRVDRAILGAGADGTVSLDPISAILMCRTLRGRGLRIVWTPYARFRRVGTEPPWPTIPWSASEEGFGADPFYNPNLAADGSFRLKARPLWLKRLGL